MMVRQTKKGSHRCAFPFLIPQHNAAGTAKQLIFTVDDDLQTEVACAVLIPFDATDYYSDYQYAVLEIYYVNILEDIKRGPYSKKLQYAVSKPLDTPKVGGEIEVSDDEYSNLKEYWSDKEEETVEIFKNETDVFDYETPLCLEFNEFNYLLKVDPDLLTNGKEPKPVKHTCKPFNYKTRCTKWPTCSWREDGYYNEGNLPGAYHIGNSIHYQDLEWYEALEDSELKDEALRNKAIMEGLISDNESSNDCWKRWKSHEIYYHNYDEGEYENETHEEGHELCEDEYDDITITSEEACRSYQEIFRMMDEGWMATRTE
ncbi:hypothetical protein Tco_1106419 [Tanacetum coccineum]